MLEVAAEFHYVKFESHAISRADGYLEEIGDMLIYLTDIILVGKVGNSPFSQSGNVRTIGEQYGIRLLAVATGASGFLKIRLDAVRRLDMYHDTHIRFVDTHTEGVGSHHNAYFVRLPFALSFVSYAVGKSGMIECGFDIIIAKEFRQFFGFLSVSDVYDGATVNLVEYVQHLGRPVLGVSHNLSEIAALKTHREHVSCPEMQFVLNVVNNSGIGGCRECEYWFIGNMLPDIRNVQVRRSEVISPLCDTVSLIDSDETDVDMSEFGEK